MALIELSQIGVAGTQTDSDIDQTVKAIFDLIDPTDRVLLIAGVGPSTSIANEIEKRTIGASLQHIEPAVKSVDSFIDAAVNADPTIVIGVGGGGSLERMKLAAHMTGATSIAVPTCLSQDALYSSSAVIERVDGSKQRHECSPPDHVVPSRALINSAPVSLRLACIADLASNWSAVADCEIGVSMGIELPPIESLNLAIEAAQGACEIDPSAPTDALLPMVELSGRAMTIAGDSRPCSGAEHKIAHALDVLMEQKIPHGLAVGLGTAFVAGMRTPAHRREVMAALAKHEIPVHPEDFGIGIDEFCQVVLHAQTLRPERFTIFDVQPLTIDEIPKLLPKR